MENNDVLCVGKCEMFILWTHLDKGIFIFVVCLFFLLKVPLGAFKYTTK